MVLVAAATGGYFYFADQDRSSAQRFALLNDDELSLYVPQGEDARSITMNAADGPQINVASPKGFQLASPVDFIIDVQPRDGVPVNMASLKIEYRLGPAWVNMTRRIMNYASVSGSRLSAKRGRTAQRQPCVAPSEPHQYRLVFCHRE